MPGWTHPVCDTCYAGLNRGEPIRMREEFRDTEQCVLCKKTTRSGIYVRIDPKDIPV